MFFLRFLLEEGAAVFRPRGLHGVNKAKGITDE